MAGIGFVLRKLSREDTLTSSFRGFFHATMASAGPWLLTVVALGLIYLSTQHLVDLRSISIFRVILLYNFCISLVVSTPITVISTRYLSDCVYRRDVAGASGMLLGALVLIALCNLPFGLYLYMYYAALPMLTALLGVMNLLLIAFVWQAAVFISALKQYHAVSYAFLLGSLVSIIGTITLGGKYAVPGLLIGFSLGFAVVFAVLLALIFAEFPAQYRWDREVFSYFRKYSTLAIGSLALIMAMWMDKWVMWTTPEATLEPIGLPTFPLYDSMMFLANLTAIPGMAVFYLFAETGFFESYRGFYAALVDNRPYRTLQKKKEHLWKTMAGVGKHLVLLHTVIVGSVLLLAPRIFEVLHLNELGIAVFRFCVLAVGFQSLTLYLLAGLSYFDARRAMLKISVAFLVLNCCGTLLVRYFGFPYYGVGYCLASVCAFWYAALLFERHVQHLIYHSFVTHNRALYA